MQYATGTKGLLQWLKNEQPQFYKKVVPLIASQQKKMNNAQYGPGLGCVRLKGLADDLTSIDVGDFSDVAPPDMNIDIAAADPVASASTGSTSQAIAATIANAANAFTSATLTQAQIQANNTLLQTNLTRAQQGLPPISASGVVASSSTTPILLIGGGLLLVLLMGRKAA
jgi:hypothetical protein